MYFSVRSMSYLGFCVFLLLAIHGLSPLLIATFGSSEYFALQTLKQASANDQLLLSSADKELKRMINLEQSKMDFALRTAAIGAASRVAEHATSSTLEERRINATFSLLKATLHALHLESEKRFKMEIEKARLEEETKRLWNKELGKEMERKDKLQRYKEKRLALEYMLKKWSAGDFDRTGLITGFMREG